MSMMNVIYSFRVPHLKVAQDNFKLRESSALWSGGYNPDILEHLINLTLEARSKLSAMK